MNQKKLYRSMTNKKLCGVCGGLGEYLAVDATVIRLIWVLAFFVWGAGVWAYLVAALIIPSEPYQM